MCEVIAAQKRLYQLGLKAEPLVTLEAMTGAAPEDLRLGDPGRDLHNCEVYVTAFAREDETLYFKRMNI